MKRIVFAVTVIQFSLTGVLWTQPDSIVSSVPPDTMMQFTIGHPVTIYASALQSPFTVSSIDSRDIELLQEPTIEPLLNATAGIWMQTGALNTNRISIRGVGYREPFATTGIKIYLDEIPLTNGAGEANIEDIHPLILSGIDIWRGPASALWGSGLGGMIHLKSDIPAENRMQTRLQAGSFGRVQGDQHVSIRYGKEDQWGTALHYQYLHDDGYRANNAYDRHSFTWMQQWRSHAGWTLNTFLHHIDLKAYIPSSVTETAYRVDPSSAAPTWAAVKGHEAYAKWISGLNLIYAPASGWVYRGSIFGTYFDSDEVRPFNVLDENNTSYGMRHRFTFPVRQTGHITAGMEYFEERYAFKTYETVTGGLPGQLLSDQEESRSYWNGFLQSDWRLGTRWYVFAGMNMAVGSLDNSEVQPDIGWDVFPTVGINYGQVGDLELSASFSRGYSSLSLDDVLDSGGQVNPDIRPETGWNVEASVKRANKDQGHARITAFIMHIRNTVITRRIMDDVFEKINGGSTLHRGLELEAKHINALRTVTTEAQMTWSWHVFDDFDDMGHDRSGNTLPGIPELRVDLRLIFAPWKSWSWILESHSVSDVYLNDANTDRASGYFLLHAGMQYSVFKNDAWEGRVSLWGHNLFGESYSSMFQINAPGAEPRYYYPGKPRSAYFSFVLNHTF